MHCIFFLSFVGRIFLFLLDWVYLFEGIITNWTVILLSFLSGDNDYHFHYLWNDILEISISNLILNEKSLKIYRFSVISCTTKVHHLTRKLIVNCKSTVNYNAKSWTRFHSIKIIVNCSTNQYSFQYCETKSPQDWSL